MRFVTKPKSVVWHIERKDTHTVCGVRSNAMVFRLSPSIKAMLTSLPAGQRICASCERMKDSMLTELA